MIENRGAAPRVVAEARKWIGTPYHNCADVQGAGVDCGMLLVRVFVDSGLVRLSIRAPIRRIGICIAARSAISASSSIAAPRSSGRSPAMSSSSAIGRCYSHGGIVTKASPSPSRSCMRFWPARLVLEEELSRNTQLCRPGAGAALFQLLGRRQRMLMNFWRMANRPRSPFYTGLQLQTSSNEIPIPIVCGTNKIAPNILWNGDFYAYTRLHRRQGSGGGKGGGSGGGFVALELQFYSRAIVLGLCEGPVGGIGAVWQGKFDDHLRRIDVTSFKGLFFPGTTPQTPWNFLTTIFPSQALSYDGVAYHRLQRLPRHLRRRSCIFVRDFWRSVCSSGAQRRRRRSGLMIQDFLTNSQYGVGFPPASIDAATLLGGAAAPPTRAYCRASALALSPALTIRKPRIQILARWLQLTNTAAVWSGGILKFIPYGDASVTGPLSGARGTSNTQSQAPTCRGRKSFAGNTHVQPELTPAYD